MTNATENAAEPKSYEIPVERMSYLAERFEKLQRRQARLAARGPLADVAPISFEIVEQFEKPPLCRNCGRVYRKNQACDDLNWIGADCRSTGPRVFNRVRVTGAAPYLAGWEFVATLEHAGEAGTILRSVPTASLAADELAPYRDSTPENCDHCRVRRARRDTFIIRALSDCQTAKPGTLRQVGRTCLGQFLGGASPERVAALAEMLIAAGGICAGADDEDSIRRGEPCVPLAELLVATIAMVREYGWLSRSKAREIDPDGIFGKPATSDRVWRILTPKTGKEGAALREFERAITDDEKKLATEILDYAAEHLADATSDYEHNLRVVMALGRVTARQAGLACSVYAWYRRATDTWPKREQRSNEFVAAVGEKFSGRVTLGKVVEVATDFGALNIHLFEDAAGNAIVWKTGSVRLKEGTEFTLTGKVKKHAEYKGRKQTELTRADAATDAELVERAANLAKAQVEKKASAARKRAAKKATKNVVEWLGGAKHFVAAGVTGAGWTQDVTIRR